MGDATTGQTLAETVADYLAARHDLGRESRRNTRYTLERFARTVGEERRLVTLARADVEVWFEPLVGTLNPNTARRELSLVRTFCRWCVAHDLLAQDPTIGVRAPRAPRALPRELDAPDVALVLKVAPDTRARLIVLLEVQEGLRAMEVAGLQLGDIDTRDRTLFVVGKGGHERVVPVSEETWHVLGLYLDEHPTVGGPLIRSYRDPTRPLTAKRISEMVIEWFRTAGLKQRPYDGRSGHALRHTAAGDILDHGADIRDLQEFLGHSLVSTTSIYLRRRAALGRLREAAAGRHYASSYDDRQPPSTR